MQRDKENTKKKFIDAVGRLVVREGFAAVGVNSVAKEAGADKTLIYRYFGDMEGLLAAFISSRDYFSNLQSQLGDPSRINSVDELIAVMKKIFIGQLREILSNKELREILIWELSADSKAAKMTAKIREKSSVDFVNAVKERFIIEDVDAEALLSILSASIYYLALRAKTVNVFTGIKFNDEGWQRMEASISSLIDMMRNKIKLKYI
jgi:AcrR family transcriptional regulator